MDAISADKEDMFPVLQTREDVIAQLEQEVDKLPEAERDKKILGCTCGGGHIYSPRSLLAAMKDPDHAEGQRYVKMTIETFAKLHDLLPDEEQDHG